MREQDSSIYEISQLAKVEILIQQKRYAEARQIIESLLAQDSSQPFLLSLLAEIYLQQDQPEQAAGIIDHSISLAPDTAHLYYIKSRICICLGQYDEAENQIAQAIALDSRDALFHAFHANIKLLRKQYQQALELAGRALEADAENLLALNIRSSALIKLDKKEEAFTTIEGALREDPNNAYTHTNYGWGLLEKGNHKKALEHFKEALQNDPGQDMARLGMLEAVKAANPLYRLFLKYSFFMSSLTAKYQWGVIIGFYLITRVLRGIAQKNEAAQPYLTPIVILLAITAFSTWVFTPVSNLFLRFNRYGRLLLDHNEKRNSSLVALSLAVSLVGLISYFLLSDERYLSIVAFGFAMMLPLGILFSAGKNHKVLKIYTLAMTAAGLSAIILTFTSNNLFNTASILFIAGFIGFQWLSNFIHIREDNK